MLFDGRYKIEAVLDYGHNAIAYRALDTQLSLPGEPEYKVLYELAGIDGDDRASLRALRRRVEQCLSIAHPAVAETYGCETAHSKVLVASEYIDGESLRDIVDQLKPEKLETHEVNDVVRSLAEALVYLHERSVVHGDIRLENILATRHGDIKLIGLVSAAHASADKPATAADDVRALAREAFELYAGESAGEPPQFDYVSHLTSTQVRTLARAMSPQVSMDAEKFLNEMGLVRRVPALHSLHPIEHAPRKKRAFGSVLAVMLIAACGLAAMFAFLTPDMRDRAVGLADRLLIEQSNTELTAGARTDLPSGSGIAVPRSGSAQPASDSPDVSVREGDVAVAAVSSVDAPRKHPDVDQRPVAGEIAGREISSSDVTSNAPVESMDVSGEREIVTLRLSRDSPPERAELRLRSDEIVVPEDQAIARIEVLVGGPGPPVDVVWWTDDGTALAGDDYASFGRSHETFAPGEPESALVVPIASDQVAEDDEHFFVYMDRLVNGRQTGELIRARVTILNDD